MNEISLLYIFVNGRFVVSNIGSRDHYVRGYKLTIENNIIFFVDFKS